MTEQQWRARFLSLCKTIEGIAALDREARTMLPEVEQRWRDAKKAMQRYAMVHRHYRRKVNRVANGVHRASATIARYQGQLKIGNLLLGTNQDLEQMRVALRRARKRITESKRRARLKDAKLQGVRPPRVEDDKPRDTARAGDNHASKEIFADRGCNLAPPGEPR